MLYIWIIDALESKMYGIYLVGIYGGLVSCSAYLGKPNRPTLGPEALGYPGGLIASMMYDYNLGALNHANDEGLVVSRSLTSDERIAWEGI